MKNLFPAIRPGLAALCVVAGCSLEVDGLGEFERVMDDAPNPPG